MRNRYQRKHPAALAPFFASSPPGCTGAAEQPNAGESGQRDTCRFGNCVETGRRSAIRQRAVIGQAERHIERIDQVRAGRDERREEVGGHVVRPHFAGLQQRSIELALGRTRLLGRAPRSAGWVNLWLWFSWPVAVAMLFGIHRHLVLRRKTGTTRSAKLLQR